MTDLWYSGISTTLDCRHLKYVDVDDGGDCPEHHGTYQCIACGALFKIVMRPVNVRLSDPLPCDCADR